MALTERTVKVKVQGTGLSFDPVTVVMRPAGEEVVWRCQGGDIRIDFKNANTPFASASLGPGKTVSSGAPTGTPQQGDTFPYQATVTRGNKPPITIDPDVEFDPSAPPPTKGGGKGRSKKKAGGKKKAKGRGRKKAARRKGIRKKK